MTATTFYSNNSFSSWAMKHLSIDETDDSQVLVHVPCQDGRWYHVTCLESKTNITPANCSCGRDHCKHQAVVTAFYSRFYKQPAKKVSSIELDIHNRMLNAPMYKNQGFSIMR